ncbi:protein of unknown function (plasmid) [Caballeronia sp. S22]
MGDVCYQQSSCRCPRLLAPDGASLFAMAAKPPRLPRIWPTRARPPDVSLAALPAPMFLRLQPAVRQRPADSAAISEAFNAMEDFMMHSLCAGPGKATSPPGKLY